MIFLLVENRFSKVLVIGDDSRYLCITVPFCIQR